MCVCVCACVRACARACLLGCVFVAMCVLNRSHERAALSVAWDLIPGHLLTFSTPLSHDIWESEIRKEWSNSLHPPNTVLSRFFFVFFVFFVGVRKVQEETSERSKKVPGRYMYGTLR